MLHMQHQLVLLHTQQDVRSCRPALLRTSTRWPKVNNGDAFKYLTLVRS
jgi:hypothetical protein